MMWGIQLEYLRSTRVSYVTLTCMTRIHAMRGKVVDVGHPARVPPVVLPPNRLRTETPQVPHTCAQRDTAADVHVRTDPDTSALRAGAHTHHTHARAYTHARIRTRPRTLQHLYGTPHVLRRHNAHPDLARVFARVLVVVRRRRPL